MKIKKSTIDDAVIVLSVAAILYFLAAVYFDRRRAEPECQCATCECRSGDDRGETTR